MGAPNKKPTSPQRRVMVRQAVFRQTGNADKTVFFGDHSNPEKRLLKRIKDLEHKLVQGAAKLVVTEADSKGKHVDIPCAAADKDKGNRNKIVGSNPQKNNEIFSDQDLEDMPALLSQPPLLTKDPTRVRRLVIVKKKKCPPLTPSLRGSKSSRKVTQKIVKKKKKMVHGGTLDQVLDSLQQESLLKQVSSSVPTTSEEEDFVMTLRRAEYWKGQHLRADTRVKHLERQKEQLERRLEHLESGVLERLEHIVSTAGSKIAF